MYNYENFAKVKEELDKKRREALDESESRTFRLRMESEEIRAIDEELSGTGFALFRAACKGEDIEPIKKRNLELQQKKKEQIKKLGYPEDYAEVKYSCSVCSDTGYTEKGGMCSCFREALIKQTILSSGMGNLIEKQTFESFVINPTDENCELMQKNLEIAKDFAHNFDKQKGGMLLIGTTGTGKTHISSAIAKVVIEKGFDVIYDSVHNIVSDYEKDKFKSDYGQKDFHVEKYIECDLLIIDDLGTEFSTPFTLSCIYNLLNTRQNKGLSTIISTNLPPEEMARKYEDRIYSRILGKDTRILSFKGKDKRLH